MEGKLKYEINKLLNCNLALIKARNKTYVWFSFPLLVRKTAIKTPDAGYIKNAFVWLHKSNLCKSHLNCCRTCDIIYHS